MRKTLFTICVLVLTVAMVGLVLAKPPLEKPLVPYESNSRAAEVEPNDDATTANPLVIGDDMNAAIDPAGDVDYFAFEAMMGDCVTFETHPGDVGDTKLYIYDTDGVTQLAYNDDGGEGFYSLIQFDFPADGTYYVTVTGYSSTTQGTYILSATACPAPQPNDTCDGAIDLQVQGLESFEIDLCLYSNDYSPPSGGCTGYTANGPEAVYMIELLPGETLSVCENPSSGYIDLAIYLVTDCADVANTCVAGDDSGNPECVVYTSENGGLYYLMVDTYSGCGLVTVTIDNPVANDDATWGAVKDLYR